MLHRVVRARVLLGGPGAICAIAHNAEHAALLVYYTLPQVDRLQGRGLEVRVAEISEKARDADRVAAVQAYSILDTPPEDFFDGITDVVSRLLNVPISLVTFLDRDRQWFKSRHGVDLVETPREYAFCNHAIKERELFVVKDALHDERFANNPLVKGPPHIRFYAGAPLFSPDGHGLGTLCAIDNKPRELSAAQRKVLVDLSALVVHGLEQHRRLHDLSQVHEEDSAKQQHKALLASMVVHDLKSPLGAIMMSASWGHRLANQEQMHEAFRDIVHAAQMMQGMLGDVLDLCLGEGGLLVARRATTDLVELIQSEITRQDASAKSKAISVAFESTETMLELDVDPMLIRRLLCNLLENAVKFAPQESSIEVVVHKTSKVAEISIRDQAEHIDSKAAQSIFDALSRGHAESNVPGRGLGLAFCRMAAEVHGGTIRLDNEVTVGNRFVVELPL